MWKPYESFWEKQVWSTNFEVQFAEVPSETTAINLRSQVPSKTAKASQNNRNIWYEVAPFVAKYAIANSKSHNIPLR